MVDLLSLRAACSPLVAWHDHLVAGRGADLTELDRALADLRSVGPVGGRLGRAIALVTGGGRGASTHETLAAIDLLRRTLRIKPERRAGSSGTPPTQRMEERLPGF